jgi:KilA-N domain
MSIIQHDFSGKQINQLLEDTEIAGQIISKGFVNATSMCKANGKKINDYTRLKTTNAYIEALSRSTGIVADLLVINNESKGTNDERGTWVHVDIAIHLSMWLSPDFAVWATQVLKRVINGEYSALTKEAQEAEDKLKELWEKIRSAGKVKRRQLTDAIQDWYVRNPSGTSRPEWLMYAVTTNAIYKALWDMDAKQIEDFLGCERNQLRNFISADSLQELERSEANVSEYIDFDNIKPIDAVPLANIRRKMLTIKSL